MLTADERAILFLCCQQHQVAFCGRCGRTYALGELRRDEATATEYGCPGCQRDLTSLVLAHTRFCHYFVTLRPMKPPARLRPESPPPAERESA